MAEGRTGPVTETTAPGREARFPPGALFVLPVLLGACGASGGGGDVPPGTHFGAEASVDWAGLRYSIEVRPAPADRIRARARVENTTGRFLSRRLPWCLIDLRLYGERGRAWEQGEAEACPGMERVVELEAGATLTLHRTLSAREILGDSLPAGEYRVEAHLPPAGGPGPPRAEIVLPLGTVRLEP